MDDNPIGFGIGFDGKPRMTIDLPGSIDLAIGTDGKVSPALDAGIVDIVIDTDDGSSKNYLGSAHDWEHREPRSRKLEAILGLAFGAATAYVADRYLHPSFTQYAFLWEPTTMDCVVRYSTDLLLGAVGGGLAASVTYAVRE